MAERSRWLAENRAALKRSRVTALVGPRQAGKTTLARQISLVQHVLTFSRIQLD